MSQTFQGTAGGLICYRIRRHLQSLYESRNHFLTELLILFKDMSLMTYCHCW